MNESEILVEDLEVQGTPGYLVLRFAADQDPVPTALVIPAVTAPTFVRQLHEETRLAVPTMWEAIEAIQQSADQRGVDVVIRESVMERRLGLSEAWLQGGGEPQYPEVKLVADSLSVSSFGPHVVVAAHRPFARKFTVALLDPLQIDRLGQTLYQAAGRSGEEFDEPAMSRVLSDLEEQEWPPPGFYPPSIEGAQHVMSDACERHLAEGHRESPGP